MNVYKTFHSPKHNKTRLWLDNKDAKEVHVKDGIELTV